MAIESGPNMIESGLAFHYDMYNLQKSFRGKPAINTCTFGTYDYGYNSTKITNAIPPVPPPITGYTIYKITSNDGNDAQQILYTGNVDQVNGGTYTHSAYVYLESGTWVSAGQHWNPWDYGTQQFIPRGVWTRIEDPVTNSTNNYGNVAMCYNTNGAVYVTASQYELGGFATPFVGGTRSTTQTLFDLTNNNSITSTSLTYPDVNTFSFNGSSDYLTIPNTTLGNGNIAWTVSCWMKTTTTVNSLGLGSILSNISGGPVYSMMGVNNGKIVYWTYQNSAWAQKLGVGKTVNDGNWHMLTWVNYSNYTMDMYVDGQLDSNVPNSTSGNNNPVDVIGRSWAGYFSGSIASLSRYTRDLSALEVLQNFNAHRSRYGI